MNLAYQVEQHLKASMDRWPFLDRAATEKRIRKALIEGQAWHWYEPKQMELPL